MMEAQKPAEGWRSALFQLVGASSQRGRPRNGPEASPLPSPRVSAPRTGGTGDAGDALLPEAFAPGPAL